MLRFLVVACTSLFLLVLVVPGCGRTSLEPEFLGDGGTVAPGTCGPSNCSNGCCDANGTCRTGRDLRACGSIGGLCSDCVASGFDLCTNERVCGRNDPTCGSASCQGCCSNDGGLRRCLSGIETTACGASGAECSNCENDGRACDLATRACGSTRCDASNCTGCCIGDKCLPGNAAFACGSEGGRCGLCASGQVCRVTSSGGGQCEGVSTCGPQNCGGCCNAAGQCVTGTDSNACGKQGDKCDTCGGNEVCVQDGLPNARTCQRQTACDPSTCAGCCVGDKCVLATTPQACGIKGNVCIVCAPGQTCGPNGTCVDSVDCDASNCAGCCVGEICAVGSQNTACGFAGVACANCVNQKEVCQGGVCQAPACGPDTCPNGCCQGNTCVNGTLDNACGAQGGAACNDCTQAAQVCAGRQCVDKCGPGNCGGCCQANNQCNTSGIANNSCGSGGNACANCAGSFCNGLVIPRRCNTQQTTCPATYGTCAAGVTEPVPTAKQQVCPAAALDTLTVPCGASPDDPACVAARAALPAACQSCVTPFAAPFGQKTGLYLCAAGFITNSNCLRSLGCATDCATTSCNQCVASSEDQCYTLVNGPAGQCRTFDNQSSCANPQLVAGQLCSQFSYANFGAWLRNVTDHYCGDGN